MRTEVESFAKMMETKLKANEAKGGWQRTSQGWLIRRLLEEVGELITALETDNIAAIQGEAADVGNFAMMIADNAAHSKFEILKDS